MNRNASNQDKLKPCPFCGGEAVLRREGSDASTRFRVFCKYFCAEVARVSEAFAICKWNTRPNEVSAGGGRWLAIMREHIQRTANNGDSVTWGSSEVVAMSATVDEWEQLAARIAAAAIEQANQK